MNDDYPSTDGPSVVEFVFKEHEGKESVRHRYDYGSRDANELIRKIDLLKSLSGDQCRWSYRLV